MIFVTRGNVGRKKRSMKRGERQLRLLDKRTGTLLYSDGRLKVSLHTVPNDPLLLNLKQIKSAVTIAK
jgi:hypothetical protein